MKQDADVCQRLKEAEITDEMISEYQRCVDAGNRPVSFALRFLVVVGVGTVIGIGLSALFADAVAGALFKTFGIGEFHAGFSVLGTVLPLIVIPFCSLGLPSLSPQG